MNYVTYSQVSWLESVVFVTAASLTGCREVFFAAGIVSRVYNRSSRLSIFGGVFTPCL